MRKTIPVRTLLAQSLIDLMHTRPYTDITITDIANAVYVSRKSYYRNFHSKEEILHEYLRRITQGYLSELPSVDVHRSPEEIIGTFLEHMKRQDALARLLYKNNLFYLLEEHICNAFRERYQQTLPEETVCFLSGACFQLYLYWFKTDYRTPAQELAEHIVSSLKLLSPIVR